MNNNYLNELDKYPFFNGLSQDEIKTFYPIIQIRHYKTDEQIIHEGETGDFMFLLLEGEVEISQALTYPLTEGSGDTREKTFIRLTHENYPFIGEMSLIQPNIPRSANVKAQKPCVIGIIKNGNLEKLALEHSHIGVIIMRNIACKLANDLRNANQNVLKLTTALSLIME